MESHLLSLKRAARKRSFWILASMLAGLALLHYFAPQALLFPAALFPLQRHAVERIIFLLPIAGASFAFGQTGGLIALGLSVLIMLPRAFLVSAYPADALLEVIAVALVGCFITWMIETQEREKRLRQKAVSRLRAINAVMAIVSQSLESERILNGALDKVLEVSGAQAGLAFLVNKLNNELVLTACRGQAAEPAGEIARIKIGEGPCGQVAQSGELLVAQDSTPAPCLTRLAMQHEGLRAQVILPLKSRNQIQGVLAIATRPARLFLPEELELLMAIGSEIGVAIENARLCENMRFYIQRITRAQEDERKRIARDLHDDTIQTLVALSRQLDVLTTLAREGDARASFNQAAVQHIQELRKMIDDAIQGVRRFSQGLRPSMLDDLGLLPTLEALAADVTDRDGIAVELRTSGTKRRLAPDAELGLFRISQEALNNVKKHSRATQVVITVEFSDNAVQLTVQDNGRGFTPPLSAEDGAASGKLGLMGMRERARLLGGTLAIRSEPGRGATLVVNVPA